MFLVNYNFKFKLLTVLFLMFSFLFVFSLPVKAQIVRDCSYFEVEGYDASGNLVSTPTNVRSLNNNTAVIYTPVGSYIRTRVKAYWNILNPPRGILYESGLDPRESPTPSGYNFTLEIVNLRSFVNNLIMRHPLSPTDGTCRYYPYCNHGWDKYCGTFCSTEDNFFLEKQPPWWGVDSSVNYNLQALKNEPPLIIGENRTYIEHSRGNVFWRMSPFNYWTRVYENSFQVTQPSTYTVATSVLITSSVNTSANWLCQDGRHPRFAVDENGNSVGFSNNHSWNDCNVCRVFINPSGCEISGPTSVSVGTSNPYTIRASTLVPEEVVNSLRVYVGKKSCVDNDPLDPDCWSDIYSVDGRSGTFSHTFQDSEAHYIICNASNNNLSQFYNGFWCSGHPSETFLSTQGVPSCGPSSNLLVNVNESSCNLSLSVSNSSINQGESAIVSATVTVNGSGSLSSVIFTLSEPSNNVVGLCSPSTSNSSCNSTSYLSTSFTRQDIFTYSTQAKIVGLRVGSSNITARATLFTGVTCEATLGSNINVLALPPWYQVVNGGISVGSVLEEGVSRPGRISAQLPPSSVCSTCYLLAGTFKGLPVANRINVGFDRLSSSPIWNVQGLVLPSSLNRNFGFYYDKVSGVLSRIMNPIDPGTLIVARNMNSFANWSSGVEYYFYNNNNPLVTEVTLDVSDLYVPIGRKIVLFVSGDSEFVLKVVGDLPPADVNGFFMIVSKFDVIFEPSVQKFTGLIHTDGSFRTGTQFPLVDEQINIVGAVYANRLILERNLISGNISRPAEVFTYLPSLMMQYPSQLSEKSVTWKEVDN